MVQLPIHLLLNNGMMSCSCFHIELMEGVVQGRVWPKLKMVTLNHIKHKPVKSKASPLIQKWESIPTWKTDEEAVDCDPSGVPTPQLPFFLASAELAETLPPADLLPSGWASFLLSKWGLLAKETPQDPCTDLFCTVKWKPFQGLVLPPLLGGKDWDKPMKDCCWASLY